MYATNTGLACEPIRCEDVHTKNNKKLLIFYEEIIQSSSSSCVLYHSFSLWPILDKKLSRRAATYIHTYIKRACICRNQLETHPDAPQNLAIFFFSLFSTFVSVGERWRGSSDAGVCRSHASTWFMRMVLLEREVGLNSCFCFSPIHFYYSCITQPSSRCDDDKQ